MGQTPTWFVTLGIFLFTLRGLEGAPWAEVDATLAAATQGAARAWELLFFHPPGPVQVWLATRGWPAAASLHNGIRISLYGLDRGPLSVTPQGIAFGPALTLVSSAAEGPQVAVADLVRLTTTWLCKRSCSVSCSISPAT